MEIEITKITSKGQVVIPQEIREEARIIEGEKFFVYRSGDSIILKRAKNLESAKNIDEFEEVFRSAWKTAKKNNVTKGDVLETIREIRVKKIRK